MAAGGGPLAGLRFALLTASSSRTPTDDLSGAALEAAVVAAGGEVAARSLLRDERAAIAALLRTWADAGGLDVILTTGGTGLGPLDLTPEASRDVADREVPGIAELLRLRGLERTPFAALSRGVAVTRGSTLIVNLPGSPTGARDGLAALLPILRHALQTMAGSGHP